MSNSASRKLVWLVALVCSAPPAAGAKSLVGTTTSTAPFSAAFQFYVHVASGHYWVAYHNGSGVELFSSPEGVSWTSRGVIFSFAPPEREWAVRYSGSEIVAIGRDRFGTTDRYYRNGTLNLDGTVSWNAAEQAVGPADTSNNDHNAAIANSKPLYYRSSTLNGGELRFGDGFDNPTVPWPASPLAPPLSTATNGSFVSGAVFSIGGADPEDLIILRATTTSPYAAGSHRLVSIKYDASVNGFDASWYNVSTLGGGIPEDATTEVIEGGTSGRERMGAVRDTNGNVHAVYINRNADVVHYRKNPGFEDASWTRLFVDVDQSPAAIDRVAISADSVGNLFLFYSKSDNAVYWRRFNGAIWGAENLLSTSGTPINGALAPMELAIGCTTGLAWAEGGNVYFSLLDTECGTYYRSMGNAANDTGTLNATQGSRKVTGVGTSWKANNRGRGDLIEIGAGDYYTVLSVESDIELTLAAPFAGATASYAFTISRKFATPQAWENCISNSTVTLPQCHDVSNASLVVDNRSEVGIAYEDTVYTAALANTPALLISGSTTDSRHTITLTADGDNRHYGIPGDGVVFEHFPTSSGSDVIAIQDPWVTVEWIELRGGNGGDGIEVSLGIGAGKVTLRANLVHVRGSGIQVEDNLIDADIYNNILYAIGGNFGIEFEQPPGSARILNNTLYNISGRGIFADPGWSAGCSPNCAYPTVLLRNNLVHTTGSGDYAVIGPDPSSSHNLSEDATATSVSPGGGDRPNVPLTGAGGVNFVDTAAGSENLHLQGTSIAIDNGVDLSAVFAFDVDAGLRTAPWDIGADDVQATTAVALVRFEAWGADSAVELTWETGAEIDNLGFHLYRSESAGGPYERITGTPIPGLGSSPAGARYRYRDTGLANGIAYYYELEDIETTGRTERHGPVSATPRPGLEAGGRGEDPTREVSEIARITYGDPSANGLEIVRRGRTHVLVRLTTEGFYAVPQEDGSVRLEVPGFDVTGEEGTPSIPVKREWIEALAGRQVELEEVQGRYETVTGMWLLDSEENDTIASANGAVRARRRRRPARFEDEAFHPSDAARIVTVAFQGESKKAQLEMAPLRWDGATGGLMLSRELLVRLSFAKVAPRERTKDGVRGRRPRTGRHSTAHTLLARFAAVEPGLYAVRYRDVLGARGGGLSTRALRLSRQGESVPYHVEPNPERFAPGSTLYFTSPGAAVNPYGREAVYELDAREEAARMPRTRAAPSGAETPYSWKTLEREVNRFYQAGLLEAPDRWLWELILAPQTRSFPFQLSELAAIDEPAQLDVWLQGTSDTPADPDHHIRLYVNGTLVSEESWDGKSHRQLTAALGSGLLREGENRLEIENAGDTEASYSTVMLDRFRVRYPRRMLAENGILEGGWSESGTATISGLGPGTVALDVTDASQPRWLDGLAPSPEGLRFRAEAGRSYLLVGEKAVLSPEVRRPAPGYLENPRNQADYVVIGPGAFLDAAAPLVRLRSRQGLTVMAVPVEDVFSEFGHGESTPEAIRDFLSYAYHEWRAPSIRYVLLLGDASYDFKDHLGTGVVNHVPPLMVKTSYLWTASDPTLAAVNGDDVLPDVAIGRLPAASIEEVRAMVDKIVTWESSDERVSPLVVLVADDPDRAGDFVANAEALIRRLPAGTTVRRIYLSELGTTETRSAIVQTFDAGASLVSYVGHGGIHLWADENIFHASLAGSLAPQAYPPIVLTMNCLNGYFHFPFFDSLSEALVKTGARGAIAAFSPSGLSLDAPAHQLHLALVDALHSGGHQRLGDAVLGAQQNYLATGAFPELLSIYHLIGDPALALR